MERNYVMDVPQTAPALPRWSQFSCCVASNDVLRCVQRSVNSNKANRLSCTLYHICFTVLSSTTLPVPVSSHYFLHTSSNFREVLHSRLPSSFSFFQFPCSCHTIDSFISLCHLPLHRGSQVTLRNFVLRALKCIFIHFTKTGSILRKTGRTKGQIPDSSLANTKQRKSII